MERAAKDAAKVAKEAAKITHIPAGCTTTYTGKVGSFTLDKYGRINVDALLDQEDMVSVLACPVHSNHVHARFISNLTDGGSVYVK